MTVKAFLEKLQNDTDCPHAPDKGPAARWQHATLQFRVMAETRALVAAVVEESLPDCLVMEGHLSPEAYSAALRLRRDFFDAGLTPHLVGRYDPLRFCSAGFDPAHGRSRAQERAYQKWRAALKAVGCNVAGLVESAACYDIRPPEPHLVILRLGLERLAGYYKLNEQIHEAAARHGLMRVRRDEGLGRAGVLH